MRINSAFSECMRQSPTVQAACHEKSSRPNSPSSSFSKPMIWSSSSNRCRHAVLDHVPRSAQTRPPAARRLTQRPVRRMERRKDVALRSRDYNAGRVPVRVPPPVEGGRGRGGLSERDASEGRVPVRDADLRRVDRARARGEEREREREEPHGGCRRGELGGGEGRRKVTVPAALVWRDDAPSHKRS